LGPVAADLVLRIIGRGAVAVALIVEIRQMHPDDVARDPPDLGVPADMIAHREFCHSVLLPSFAPPPVSQQPAPNAAQSAVAGGRARRALTAPAWPALRPRSCAGPPPATAIWHPRHS